MEEMSRPWWGRDGLAQWFKRWTGDSIFERFFMLMLVSTTLTLVQGHSGSAKEIKMSVNDVSRQLSK